MRLNLRIQVAVVSEKITLEQAYEAIVIVNLGSKYDSLGIWVLGLILGLEI